MALQNNFIWLFIKRINLPYRLPCHKANYTCILNKTIYASICFKVRDKKWQETKYLQTHVHCNILRSYFIRSSNGITWFLDWTTRFSLYWIKVYKCHSPMLGIMASTHLLVLSIYICIHDSMVVQWTAHSSRLRTHKYSCVVEPFPVNKGNTLTQHWIHSQVT